MVELLLILTIGFSAREEAALRLDAAVERLVSAIVTRADDLPAVRQEVGDLELSLRAMLERERMTEIDLTLRIEELRAADTPESRAEGLQLEEELRLLQISREVFLARRAVTERQQQAALAAAVVTSSPGP